MSDCDFRYPIRWPDLRDDLHAIVGLGEPDPLEPQSRLLDRFIEVQDFRDRKLEEKFETMPCGGGGGAPSAWQFSSAVCGGSDPMNTGDSYRTSSSDGGSIDLPAGTFLLNAMAIAYFDSGGSVNLILRDVAFSGNLLHASSRLEAVAGTYPMTLVGIFTSNFPITVELEMSVLSDGGGTVAFDAWTATVLAVDLVDEEIKNCA